MQLPQCVVYYTLMSWNCEESLSMELPQSVCIIILISWNCEESLSMELLQCVVYYNINIMEL